jgi:3D-(3,5/4)-trihydroxycyclohexane-1,2-dione acylhydrolase (decyclizing)
VNVDAYRDEAARLGRECDAEVARLYALEGEPPAQSAAIGAVNDAAGLRDVVVCAAGSMPGDLHKLWRTRDPKGYHVEYGYSCMGYEIAGGLGVELAAPDREVYVLVGEGSYLMLPDELATAAEEGIKLIVVLVDSHGYRSIGASRARSAPTGWAPDARPLSTWPRTQSRSARARSGRGRSTTSAPRSPRPATRSARP